MNKFTIKMLLCVSSTLGLESEPLVFKSKSYGTITLLLCFLLSVNVTLMSLDVSSNTFSRSVGSTVNIVN